MSLRRKERRAEAKGQVYVNPTTLPTLAVEVRCPKCGGPVAQQNSRKSRSELTLIVACTGWSCGCLFVARLVIVPAHPDELGDATRCGTAAGHQRHVRAGEPPCRPCTTAHTDAVRKTERRRAGK